MKHTKTIALTVALGLTVCGLAIAQVHRGGMLGHIAAEHHADTASIVKHLSEAFPQIAAFDANKDGKLDAAEKDALAKALADGRLQLPAHAVNHNPVMMLDHIADMYARVVLYDVNHDGQLDETEQMALKSAIETGELDLHAQPPHGEEGVQR